MMRKWLEGVDEGRKHYKTWTPIFQFKCALVGVGVVVVVLDAPGLEGVDERREHEGPHDVLQQLVLAEAAVPTVVPDHEELQQGCRNV